MQYGGLTQLQVTELKRLMSFMEEFGTASEFNEGVSWALHHVADLLAQFERINKAVDNLPAGQSLKRE